MNDIAQIIMSIGTSICFSAIGFALVLVAWKDMKGGKKK